jgi:hypothetical protein
MNDLAKSFVLSSLGIFLLSGCGETYDSAFGRGSSDGYAAGYNTTCKIRSTIVAGDWDIPGYQEGYNAGYREGANDCTFRNE